MQKLVLITLLISTYVAACSPATTPRASAPAAVALRTTPPFTAAEFRQLRWLEGRWRGGQPNGERFYEGYRLANDSTLRSYDFADSVSTTPKDSSEIRLRSGVIVSGSGNTRWEVAELSGARVHFIPVQGARNDFTWEKLSADEWKATLHWPANADRAERTVIYPMTRLRN